MRKPSQRLIPRIKPSGLSRTAINFNRPKSRTRSMNKKKLGLIAAQKLSLVCKALNMPEPQRELIFFKGRRWRFDFAWPEIMIAVEVEGGIWVNGAHSRGAHFLSDCEKYNTATREGWKVFRFGTNMVKDGTIESFMLGVFEKIECREKGQQPLNL